MLLRTQLLGAEDGMSVFGSRVVHVAAGQQRIEVGTVFGSVKVVVPDDVRVRSTGVVLFGSLSCEQACAAAGGQREVVVEGNGIFGSVGILRQSELDDEREAG